VPISRILLMAWAIMIAYPVQLPYAHSQGLEEMQAFLYTDCHALFVGQWADLPAEESSLLILKAKAWQHLGRTLSKTA